MPQLVWNDFGNPFNEDFQDGYFCAQNGLEESRHVFLAGNNLPKAWEGKDSFCIGECGFGTGLNLLTIWELFLTCKKPPKRLEYFSFEGFPLLSKELAKALKGWPELDYLAKQLQKQYPKNPQNGTYSLQFGSLHVKLVIGMAPDAIGPFHKPIDAWFLDGFAPSKNPQMWSPELFQAIANHSKIGSTFATFTVASKVRKGLSEVGFNVQKRVGFGQKREMSVGVMQ
jgi:tRNA 5-methylaminomethyl-2-thiouridine biosynthesis bifunctional protein